MKPGPKTLLLTLLVCAGFTGQNVAAAADLAADAAQAIDSRLAKTQLIDGGQINLYRVADYAHGGPFSWNPLLWCGDLTAYLSCFSPWNSNEGQYQGGTLITPKHALFAEHFSGRSGSNTLHAGDKLAFLGKTGISYKRTLKATPERVGTSDLCVGTFTEFDLPPDVLPAQVLPPGVQDSQLPAGTPVIFLNKDKQTHVAELVSLTAGTIRPATDPKRKAWTLDGPAYVGDSGCPIFVVLGGRLVLVTQFTTPTAGPVIANYTEEINALLGSRYRVRVAKLVP